MPKSCTQVQRHYRLVRRASPTPHPELQIRPLWPSPFAYNPLADAWIADEGDGILTLYVDDCCLSVIQGVALDQCSFNHLLDRLRCNPPRARR